MIEVTAKLVGGPVYLPGESIGCYISFSNPPVPSDTRSRSNSDVLETLAWASAQIHCLRTTSDKISFPNDKVIPEEISISNSETSFAPCRGDRGHIVLSTKPKILFCDLRLSPGESKTYLYSEVLPSESPPSYRGQLVKYSYKITVGTQRVNCPIKQLRVPLRVLVFNGIPEALVACEETVDLSPSNPFLESNDKTLTHNLFIAQMMQNITARRSPNFFNINNKKGKVARFCLFKQAYKLGEDIIGTFDFSCGSVPCVQFTVTLQCEELIAEAYKNLSKQDKSILSYSVCHEVCLSMQQCVLNLPIPLHVTPDFDTDIISLRWRLHFEFVTTDPAEASLNTLFCTDTSSVSQGPQSLPIETMVWDLPIQIYPTILTPDSHSLTKYSIVI